MTDAPFDMPPASAGFDARAGWVVTNLMVDVPPLKLNHAGAIVGNLGGESGLTAINERHPLIPGSRGGFGWGQWTGPRRRAFEAWCASVGLSETSDEANYRWLLAELRGDEKHALAQLLKTTTIEAATETFEAYYERPKDLKAGLDDRIAYAKRAITAALGLAHAEHFSSSSPAAPAALPDSAVRPRAPTRLPVHPGHMTGGMAIGFALTVTLCWVLTLYGLDVPATVAGAWTLLLAIPAAVLLHRLPWLKTEIGELA